MNKRFSVILVAFFLVSCGGNVKNQEVLKETQETLSQDQGVQVQREDQELKITLDDILFDFNKITLKSQGQRVLKDLTRIMKKYPNTDVAITGHSDNIGPEWAKKKIADGRALTVFEYLTKRGISSSRLAHKGRSDKDPLVPNTSKENRQKNRRVELRLSTH